MAKKWMNLAKKALEPADEAQYTYSASNNGQSGYVVLSNRKLLFVSKKGIFRKTYDLVLEVPYDKIDEVRRVNDVTTLIEGDKRHVFKSGYAGVIEESVKQLKESIIAA